MRLGGGVRRKERKGKENWLVSCGNVDSLGRSLEGSERVGLVEVVMQEKVERGIRLS